MTITNADKAKALATLTDAVLETLAESSQPIPNGHVYMVLMAMGMSYNTYTAFINALAASGLIQHKNNLLMLTSKGRGFLAAKPSQNPMQSGDQTAR